MAADPGSSPLTDIRALLPVARAFGQDLLHRKQQLEAGEGFWYPYDILANLWHLDAMLAGDQRDLAALIGGRRVADVGAADGDLSFLLASLGVACDVIDHGESNFNQLAGAHRLAADLGGAVEVHDVDLDRALRLPRSDYGLVFLLGILYHLKNPFGVLETLATQTEYCFLSTRVARRAPDRETPLAPWPLAYLVDAAECNADASNFWVFTPEGLLRLLERTGWDVLSRLHRGDVDRSDPASDAGDERMFVLLRSRRHRDAAP